MTDDTDEKIRRNLVVASALILLSAWLDIPFSAFLAKLIEPARAAPEVYKFWAVGFAIMAYLGLRYYFSAEGEEYRTRTVVELDAMRRKKALILAQKQADRFTKNGSEPQVFNGLLTQFATDRTTSISGASDPMGLGRPKMRLSFYRADPSPYTFAASAECVWNSDKGTASSSGGTCIEVNVEKLQKISVDWASRVHVWTYSESSIRYLIPVVLALCAVASLFMKIIASYIEAN